MSLSWDGPSMGFLPLPTCWGRAPSNMASSISEHWNCTSKLIEKVDTIAIVTYIYIFWLVVSTPLKNMTSSVGIMKFPTGWKNKIHVPYHQAEIYLQLELHFQRIELFQTRSGHDGHALSKDLTQRRTTRMVSRSTSLSSDVAGAVFGTKKHGNQKKMENKWIFLKADQT